MVNPQRPFYLRALTRWDCCRNSAADGRARAPLTVVLLAASASALANLPDTAPAAGVPASEAPPAQVDNHVATSSAGVTLNMRDADIRAVVHWLSNVTGKRFVIDPRVKGQMTILAKTPLSVEQAYHVVVGALQVHGFATVDSGALVRIVPDSLAKSQPVALSEMLDLTSSRAASITLRRPPTSVPRATAP